MTITKDVIRDLLPVYSAGEASADTRALVEEFLRTDPELRQLAAAAGTLDMVRNAAEPPASLEWETLRKTRRLLQRRAWLLAFAWSVTLLALALDVRPGMPVLSSVFAITAIAGWIAFLDTCRRLSATGFEAPHTWRTSMFWAVGGYLVGTLLGLVLHYRLGTFASSTFGGCASGVGMMLGRRWRQIPEDQTPKPISLFDGRK